MTEGTRHLLRAPLALMKPTAYLINMARGPIVDQQALTRVLQEKRIAGAGLDVFEPEPIDPRDPLLALDNVILAPHALSWTDECFAGIGRRRNCKHSRRGGRPSSKISREPRDAGVSGIPAEATAVCCCLERLTLLAVPAVLAFFAEEGETAGQVAVGLIVHDGIWRGNWRFLRCRVFVSFAADCRGSDCQ